MADNDDFLAMLQDSMGERQMKEIFDMFDQDKDGVIDMDELRRIFQ